MDILCNYQGFKKCVLILVFDAYRVPGSPGSIEQYHNIHVVYTKEAETADMFIERVTHEIGKNRRSGWRPPTAWNRSSFWARMPPYISQGVEGGAGPGKRHAEGRISGTAPS